MNRKQATAIIGSLGTPSKMPGPAWGISVKLCNVGSKLAKQAGTVCDKCYAIRGFYKFPSVRKGHEKRINLFHQHKPELWIAAMVRLVKKESVFRWFDSGDLQSLEMLERIAEVARQCPDTRFWLPTKEHGIVSSYALKHKKKWPDNLTIRLSGYVIDGPAPKNLAKRLGVQVSSVTAKGGFTCPAPQQGNECRQCRACWDKNKFEVIYKKH